MTIDTGRIDTQKATPKTDDQWIQLARDAHEGSKRYFDAGVRAQIDDDLRQFYGQHPQGSKYYSDSYKGRSKLFRPKTRAAIRFNEATAAEALFTTDDLVSMTPEDEDDPIQVASAAINQQLVQYRLSKTIPWFVTCMGAYQDAQAVGVCLSYNYWRYNKAKKIDRPCIDLKPPENFRFDAAADWRDVVNTSPYLIEEIPMFVKDVKGRMQGPEGGNPKWRQYSDGELLSAAQPYTNVSTRLVREKGRTDSTTQGSAINDFSVVWVHRNIVEVNGEDWVYYTLGGSFKLLTTPLVIEKVYWHGKRPYTMGFCMIETHKTYPSGVSRLSKDLQAETNEVANQRIDNVKLAMNRRWLAKRGALVDVNSLRRNLPNSVTLVNDIAGDVKQLEFDDVTASAYQEQDRLNLDFDDLIGTFSGSSVAGDRRMSETVGGMNIYNANNNKLSGYQLRVWIDTWVIPTLRQLSLLEQKYETDQVILALAGKKAKLWQHFERAGVLDQYVREGDPSQLAITDELLEQELTCTVNVGMNATDPTKQIQRFMYGLTQLKEVLEDDVLVKYNLNVEEVVKEIFGKLGFRDGKRFFKFTGEDPRIAELQQMNSDLQQQLKSKKPDPALVAAQIDKIRAEIDRLTKEGVKLGVESAFAAMQAAQVISATPQVAGVADVVMKSAGYEVPNPAGESPEYPAIDDASGIVQNPIKDRRTGIEFTPPGGGAASAPGSTVPPNTDPEMPAKPATGGVGEERGIETNRPDSA